MDYANLHGRAARLDCVALDTANKVYNLEIQQFKEGRFQSARGIKPVVLVRTF